MSELAFNINGEPFEVPPTMAAWRVRKLKRMGAPEVVFGRDGLPLFLPMDADVEDLRREAGDGPGAVGRYRLDPVDDRNRLVPDAQASYVYVHPVERAPEPVAPAAPTMIQADATAQLIAALLESQKQHTELARMYVSQFPVLANAMAAVVRSAGDVGLTARVPIVLPVAPETKPAEDSGDKDDEDDNDDADDESADIEESAPQVAPEPEHNWPRVAQSALELVNTHLGPLLSGIKLPGMGARPAANNGAERAERTPSATEATEPSQGAPASDIMTHLNAIRAALSPEEGAFVMVMAEEMALPVKLAWANKLRGMSVPEAVASIRAELAELERNRVKAERAPAPGVTSPPSAVPSRAPVSAPVPPTPPNAATVRRREGWPTAGSTASARGAAEAPARPVATSPATLPVSPTAPGTAQPLVDAPAQTHITAIQRALTGEEDAAMRRHFMALSPADRAAWIAMLLMLPVPEAIATIRAELAADRAGVASADVAHPGDGKRPAAPPIRAELAADRAGAPVDVAHPGERERPAALPIRAEPAADRAGVAPADVAHPGERARPAAPTIRAELAADHAGVTRADVAPLSEGEHHAASRNRAVPAMAAAADARSKDAAPRAEMPVAAPTALEHAITAPAAAQVPAAATAATLGTTAPSAVPRTVVTNADMHLVAIESALTADERERVYRMIATMSPEDREVWLDRLLSVSVADGAAIFREALQELTTQELAHQELDVGRPDTSEPTPDDREELDGDEELDDAQELDLDDAQERDDGAAKDRPAPREPGALDASPAQDTSTSANERDAAPLSSMPTALAAAESLGLPTLDPAALTRFAAIQSALTLAEKMRAHELAAQLSAAELRAWITELGQLPVPEAVAKIRAALAVADRDPRLTKNGGVS